SRGFTLVFMPAVLVLTSLGRVGFRVIRRHIEGLETGRPRVLLVGQSLVAKHFIEKSLDPESRLNVVGVLDDELAEGTIIAAEVPVVGKIGALSELAKKHDATGIIITSSKIDHERVLELLEICLAQNLTWQLVPSAYELMLDRVTMDVVHGVPLLGMR